MQTNADILGAGMPGYVGQCFLRDAEDGVLRANRQFTIRGQFADLGGDLRASAILQRFALLAQCFDQTYGFQRRGAKVVQHGFHLGHRFSDAVAYGFKRRARAVAVGFPSSLNRRRANVDAEELLFDRIVQLARQPVALLLRSGFVNLLRPLLAQRLNARLRRDLKTC